MRHYHAHEAEYIDAQKSSTLQGEMECAHVWRGTDKPYTAWKRIQLTGAGQKMKNDRQTYFSGNFSAAGKPYAAPIRKAPRQAGNGAMIVLSMFAAAGFALSLIHAL